MEICFPDLILRQVFDSIKKDDPQKAQEWMEAYEAFMTKVYPHDFNESIHEIDVCQQTVR